jgi:hypothetical protein
MVLLVRVRQSTQARRLIHTTARSVTQLRGVHFSAYGDGCDRRNAHIGCAGGLRASALATAPSTKTGAGPFSYDYPGLFPVFHVILCSYTAAHAPINATAWNHTELLVLPGTENMRQLYTKTARAETGASRIDCGMTSII